MNGGGMVRKNVAVTVLPLFRRLHKRGYTDER